MIHCQKCTTRNPLNREFCWKCGSRLLVSSGTTPFDASIPFHGRTRPGTNQHPGVFHQPIDQAGRFGMMETIERVAASNFIDHTMIETLTDSLESAGIDLANLEAEWRKRIDSRILETEEVERLSSPHATHHGPYRGRTASSSVCGSKSPTICSSRIARRKACTFSNLLRTRSGQY